MNSDGLDALYKKLSTPEVLTLASVASVGLGENSVTIMTKDNLTGNRAAQNELINDIAKLGVTLSTDEKAAIEFRYTGRFKRLLPSEGVQR